MSQIKIIVVLLFAIAFVSYSAKSAPIEIDVMAGIQQLYESKQYDAAIAQLEPLLEKHPTDVKGHHILIRCYAEKQRLDVVGMHTKALETYQTALKINPEVQGTEKKSSDAETSMKDAQTYFLSGNKYVLLGNYSKAVAEYKKAIELGLKTDLVYAGLGFALFSMKNYPEAVAALQEALNLNPENGEARMLLDYINASQAGSRDFDARAIPIIFVESNIDDADAYFRLGETLLERRSYANAIPAYQIAIGLGEQHIKNYRQLGVAYRHTENYDEAIKAFESVLQIDPKNRGIQNWLRYVKAKRVLQENPDNADAHFEIGCACYNDGYFDVALRAYGKVLKLSPNFAEVREWFEKAQHAKKAANLSNTGDEAYNTDAYQEALTLYNEALNIYRRIDNRAGEANQLGNIGNVYYSTGDYPKALECYQKALAIDQEIGYRHGEATLRRMKTVYDPDDYKDYTGVLGLVVTIDREIGYQQHGEAADLGNIGNVYYSTGNYPKALEYYQNALAIDQENGYRYGEATNLNNIGIVYKSIGDYDRALEYYQEALTIAKDIEYPKRVESTILGNLGNVYNLMGFYDRALEYHLKTLVIAKEMLDKKGEATTLSNIGTVHYYTSDYLSALVYYQLSLAITGKINERRVEAYVLSNIGELCQTLQQYPQALDYLNQALQLSRETGIRPAELSILATLGETHQAMKNFEQAVEYLQDGLKLAQTLGIPNALWQCQFHIGEIAEEQEKPEEAITNYKQAVETIESMREKLQTKEMQVGFMRVENKTEVYERLIKLLIELGRNKEALEYLERSKSETLREDFGRVKPEVKDEKVRRGLEMLEELEHRVDATASKLVEAKSEEEIKNLTKLLAETKGQVNQVMMDLEQNYHEIYQFLTVSEVFFDVIQQRIPPDTLLVEYCVLPEEIYLFALTSNSFTLKSVKISREQLNALVLAYREGIQYLDDVSELSSNLYRILIGPIEAEIASVKTVTIVPYGLLYYLPFHALEQTAETGERQFLFQWKRVSYLTSSTLMDFVNMAMPSADTPAQPLIAFGNPDGTLEGALHEVEELKTIIPDATVYVLDAAQKQVFLTTAGDYQLVHLATHGYLSSDPKRSYLVLAPKDTGNLTVWEIAGLVELFRKHKSIVVLSACNTAVENIKKEQEQGKAVMSLAGAFARAGCPTLIASLWKVSDESTQQLMTEFYRALHDGQGDILDALRQAQLTVMQTAGQGGKYAHPYYWAPFILIGELKQ